MTVTLESNGAPSGASITNHILTIPHAQFTHFLTQVVHLRSASSSSLFVHCTSVSPLHARTLLAGHAQESAVSGVLGADFALAMVPPNAQPLATSVSSTLPAASAGMSAAWSKRIARRLQVPQLLLSLDLPQQLLATTGQVQAPQDSHALLALERALRDACASALTSAA